MAKVNLVSELEKVQIKRKQEELIVEVKSFLSNEASHEWSIKNRVEKNHFEPASQFTMISNKLNQSLIFDLESIQLVCTRFRLRFLSSKLFKNEIPVEAVRAVKRTEMETGHRFTKFRIMAPASLFHLKDSTKDPILFAELPNGRFYYIYKWGGDMTLTQQLINLPFQHMGALAVFSMVVGFLTMVLLPSMFSDWRAEAFYRFFFFSTVSALVMTVAIIIGITNSKDFSENVWNSAYLR